MRTAPGPSEHACCIDVWVLRRAMKAEAGAAGPVPRVEVRWAVRVAASMGWEHWPWRVYGGAGVGCSAVRHSRGGGGGTRRQTISEHSIANFPARSLGGRDFKS